MHIKVEESPVAGPSTHLELNQRTKSAAERKIIVSQTWEDKTPAIPACQKSANAGPTLYKNKNLLSLTIQEKTIFLKNLKRGHYST